MPEIVIAGAGPAGCAMALELIYNGVPPGALLICDAADFPRHKLCGGGITSRGWERLQRWEINPVHTFEAEGIRLLVNGVGQTLSEPGRLATVDRWELDQLMLLKVQAAGIRFLKGRLHEARKSWDGWIVKIGDQTLHTRLLIGADGFSSVVRRSVQLPQRSERGRVGRLLELVLPADELPAAVLEMEFSPVLSGVAGYLWKFPFRSAEDGLLHIKYGIMDRSGTVSTVRLRTLLREYLPDSLHAAAHSVVSGYPERYYHPFDRFIGPSWLLLGDARGIDPLLGEGLAFSFEQAASAAVVVARAWRSRRPLPRWYNITHPFTSTGWNHWFLSQLGDFVYGRYGRFWLQILTADTSLARLSRRPGFGGFGRFGRHGLRLTGIALRHLLLAPLRKLFAPVQDKK